MQQERSMDTFMQSIVVNIQNKQKRISPWLVNKDTKKNKGSVSGVTAGYRRERVGNHQLGNKTNKKE
jgi:hypothetical protein